ncbi:serine/threonine protein kinase [Actinomadura rayongensis]|uniref:Protein kinase n=1 Tax=Actinomadura rayongensis TaxID=1429076 RepID=A0A6I4WEZ0_9ACTN|nr:serine/threonine-protein kinase [Actinomadura rayongensis]MXQ66426.1 protein kinase [Actinomadura rayongensis]
MPDAAPLEPGDPRALGQYEVVGRLGAGGQGAVFLGRVRGGGAYVAIKLLHTQMAADPSARARFTREVAAAQKVEPFCTARVLEADVQGDQPYVVSEFIDGPSLHDAIAHNGPFGREELERLAIGTVTALAAIHEAGIVHRDFKPNNVMLASDGPRVVDFGIARTVNSQESAVTATGMVVGTPGYLAPEQLTGAPLTPAVDIFAWGATMVFAATGQSPFEAETLPVIINKILNDEPDLSALPAGHLRDLIGRCLSKDAGLRPPAAQLLLFLLDGAGAAPAGQGADAEALMNQGTRIASQLPAPPAPPAPRPPQQPPHHQPQQAITPPPMPLNQAGFGQQGMGQAGPHTPPPQPLTPPPMPMYQGGPQPGPGTPPPMRGPATPGPMMAGPYGPPPPKPSGTNPGVFIGIGCGVLALIALIAVVVVVVVANSGNDDPIIDYSPSPTFSSALGGGLIGTYKGTGYQPNTSSGGESFTPSFYLFGKAGTATYTYTDGHSTCYTKLTLMPENTNSVRYVYREESLLSDKSQCADGYVSFLPSSSTTMRWEWRQSTPTAGSALAYGTVTKQ